MLAAKAAGVEVKDDAPDRSASQRSLAAAVAEYLDKTKANKSKKTLAACITTVNGFLETCKKEFLEDLDRKDLLDYIADLKRKGNSPRTIRNRVDFFQIFLHHFGLPSLLKGKDLLKFTEKQVRAYSAFDLERMFGRADQEESDLLHFMLCTGLREQEIQYASWSDLDLAGKTVTVTEKLDLSFRPKDCE